MKARSAALSNGKQIEVELDENDAQSIPQWDELGLLERWRALSNKADEFIVEYMLRRGEISKDYAGQRIREIRGQS